MKNGRLERAQIVDLLATLSIAINCSKYHFRKHRSPDADLPKLHVKIFKIQLNMINPEIEKKNISALFSKAQDQARFVNSYI